MPDRMEYLKPYIKAHIHMCRQNALFLTIVLSLATYKMAIYSQYTLHILSLAK